MALRRRARRRLVGAVAIALAAVVVLPMLFDPEPKPLGPEVDIRIPAKDTQFDAAPGAPVAPALPPVNEPAPREAEPTLPPPAPAKPVAEASDKTVSAETTAPKPAETKLVDTKAVKLAEKETTKAEKVAADAKVGKKAAEMDKPHAKADAASTNKGHFLQLGAFGSEANAKHLQEKAQAAGFKVALSSGNGQYRVRVGPFSEQAQALEAQAKLKAKGFSPVLMGP